MLDLPAELSIEASPRLASLRTFYLIAYRYRTMLSTLFRLETLDQVCCYAKCDTAGRDSHELIADTYRMLISGDTVTGDKTESRPLSSLHLTTDR